MISHKFPIYTIRSLRPSTGNFGISSMCLLDHVKINFILKCCRAECSCNPVRLFAIVSMQRSGSGWFETLLNSHSNITSNGEIFSVAERRRNISSITGTLDKVYNLDWFTSASKNQCSAAVGFKWMLNQVNIVYTS